MNNKGVSPVIIAVLLILIVIVAAAIVYVVVLGFINDGAKNVNTNQARFEVQVKGDDILYDRFRIKNLGQVELTSYSVKIDNQLYPIVVHRRIVPLEEKYIYLLAPFPAGEHTLLVTSSNYFSSQKITVPEDWHVIINETIIQ